MAKEDICTGCGGADCSHLWSEQKKCCPDCSHQDPDPREEVLWFAKQMERKLRANDHKGHWSNCDDLYLKRRLREETNELIDAVNRLKSYRRTSPDDVAWAARMVIREAADVANFAMMIADNSRQARKCRFCNKPTARLEFCSRECEKDYCDGRLDGMDSDP